MTLKQITNTAATNLTTINQSIAFQTANIASVHASNEAGLDLYIENAAGVKFYTLKSVKIPVGVTLVIGKEQLAFNWREYKLVAKLSAGSVDIKLA